MTLKELFLNRQSVRRYTNQAINRDDLDKCIEAARLAPSASNSQPWTFVVVDDPELKNEVAEATYSNLIAFNKFTPQAPVMVVIVIEKPKMITQAGGAVKNREFPLIDIGIASEHFCLQAADLGIGTCMLGWFNERKIKKILNIPKGKRIGLVISMGYAPEDYKLRDKTRKSTEMMSAYNKYPDAE